MPVSSGDHGFGFGAGTRSLSSRPAGPPTDQVGHVEAEWRPAAEVVTESRVVPPHFGIRRRSLDMQQQPPAGWRSTRVRVAGRLDRALVPTDAVELGALVVLEHG